MPVYLLNSEMQTARDIEQGKVLNQKQEKHVRYECFSCRRILTPFWHSKRVLLRKSTACSYPTKLKSMQKVRKIFTSGEQKRGRCGGSQRISFRSGVKLEFRFNRKFLVWNIDYNIFLDENNKPEPSPTTESKPGINLWWSLKLRNWGTQSIDHGIWEAGSPAEHQGSYR